MMCSNVDKIYIVCRKQDLTLHEVIEQVGLSYEEFTKAKPYLDLQKWGKRVCQCTMCQRRNSTCPAQTFKSKVQPLSKHEYRVAEIKSKRAKLLNKTGQATLSGW